ncbi:MAG: hypothetical protein LLF76_07710 [Planctomycetaceae bacterium]|nr:hypothetical protein [Planctomycetaceae bacterium]
MSAWKMSHSDAILWAFAGLMLTLAGCSSPERVYYYGPKLSAQRSALIVTTSRDALQKAGYTQIGTIQSEPMTQSARVPEGTDNEALLESLAPEKNKQLVQYNAWVDQQACERAARAGGSVLRLEEIRHTYGTLTPESAVLLGTDFGKDVRTVTSVKIWSVWRAPQKK